MTDSINTPKLLALMRRIEEIKTDTETIIKERDEARKSCQEAIDNSATAWDRLEAANKEIERLKTLTKKEGAAIATRSAVMDDNIKVQFHRWRDRVRCAIGDGSLLFTETTAIVEMQDGQVIDCEPYRLRFITKQGLASEDQEG